VRVAVVADPGWRLVVADARQLEPRVLAAMSGDPDLARAALDDDLYAGLAAQSFGGDRSLAKVGLLSAMYGGASPALSVLRRSYPEALALLETAARAGERGESVRSVLGRTSPRADLSGADEEATVSRERAWGRFTRNFVVQASAADWANVLLSVLRGRLVDIPQAQLVFFQHDEVVLHVPAAVAEPSAEAVRASAAEATTLVFGSTPVAMPLAVAVVDAYADAK
jgi:DNA polymerase-1